MTFGSNPPEDANTFTTAQQLIILSPKGAANGPHKSTLELPIDGTPDEFYKKSPQSMGNDIILLRGYQEEYDDLLFKFE